MKKLYALAIVALSISLFACGDGDSMDAPVSCSCGNEAVEFPVGIGSVFMPNIFTPNGDGINDVYFPFGGIGVQGVDELEIKDEDGNILFFKKDFHTNSIADAWDGSYEGKTFVGQFEYSIRFKFGNGSFASYSSKGCSFPCRKGDILNNLENCKFGTQSSTSVPGGYDPGSPSLETLDCL